MDGSDGVAVLLFQQQRREVDLLRGNQGNSKLLKKHLVMKKAEQLVCGPVAQLFSFVGIDVAHHKGYIILIKIIET